MKPIPIPNMQVLVDVRAIMVMNNIYLLCKIMAVKKIVKLSVMQIQNALPIILVQRKSFDVRPGTKIH